MVLVNFSVFFLVVFVIFCWCLCFWISFIIPFSLLNFVLLFFFLLSFFWGLLGDYISSCCCYSFSFLLLFVFLLLRVLFLHHLCCSYLLFLPFLSCFFACISFDCSCCCGCCLYSIPPLSHLVFLLLPRPPRAHLKRRNTGNNKYFILFAFGGALRKCPFTISWFIVVLWWISFIHRTCFVWCSWKMFWGTKGLFLASLLLLLLSLLLLLPLFLGVRNRAFFRISFVSCVCTLWIRCLLFSCSLFWLSA